MALKYANKGIEIIAGFDLRTSAPLDSRTVVKTIADLNALAENLYEGITVYVEEDSAKYTYVRNADYDEEVEGSSLYVWRKDISSADTFDVEDSLSSTSTKNALSANQGRVLNEQLTTTTNTANTNKEDIAKLVEEDTKINENIDTIESNLNTLTTTVTTINGDDTVEGSFRNAIKEVADAHSQDINALQATDTEIKADITTLQGETALLLGDAETAGSVKNLINEAKTEVVNGYTAADEALDGKITEVNEELTGKLAEEVQKLTNADSTLDSKIDTLETNLTDSYKAADEALDDKITELSGKVDTNTTDIESIANSLNTTIEQVNKNTTAITTLNGDDTVEGSVDKKIADALAPVKKDLAVAGTHKIIVETANISTDGQTAITFGSSIPEGYSVCDDTIKLIINSMTYVEVAAFRANRLGNVCIWTLTNANGGFDLETDDVVQVEYGVKYNSSGTTYQRVDINRATASVTTEGDFDVDPSTYTEVIDLSGASISNFYGVVINGVTYTGDQAVYDEASSTLTLTGIRTTESDSMIAVSQVTE